MLYMLQRDSSWEDDSTRNKLAGTPGPNATSKLSSPRDKPSPLALMYASLREKKRAAISSPANSGLINSISTPMQESRASARRARLRECDRLNFIPDSFNS